MNHVINELGGRSLKAVADRLRVDDHTVTTMLCRTLASQPICWPARGEIRVGFDGHTLTKKRAPCTVTELRTGRLLTILPDDRQQTKRTFIRSIPQEIRYRITEVCIDLDQGYRAAIEQELPKAKVVADHFHIIKLANEVINDVRLAMQDPRHRIPKKVWLKGKERLRAKEYEQLIHLADDYPLLFQLWALKEDLRQVYEMRNRRVAAYRFRKVIEGYRSLESGYARTFAGTLDRWCDPILNFFDHRTTNAYTEGLHRKFKMLQRISFGFRNPETYIAKITLTCVPLWFILQHTQFR